VGPLPSDREQENLGLPAHLASAGQQEQGLLSKWKPKSILLVVGEPIPQVRM
jgi:hypothetical protein